MITSLGVAILTILWILAAIWIIHLVEWFGQVTFDEQHPIVDRGIGLLLVGVLTLAPLIILILVKAN